ncbi:hypothetical protein ACFSSA_09875 [Luteolibacter algae]|uniref:Uncharacterized protein n=1 Tax=Luteolibacter algae TaxID=454151 RepID=A0ABW5D8X6_9BACT
MRPIPKEEGSKDISRPIPSIPLNTPGSYSTSNRRVASCPVQKVYPWLLFASTAVAATFCLAYITKPVIVTENPNGSPEQEISSTASSDLPPGTIPHNKITPDRRSLPGESPKTGQALPPALTTDYEETNLRIQHVLDAESPGGDVSRIVIDVPVLYQSRNLLWTQREVSKARELLEKLTIHQEKTRDLRDEGKALLSAWNQLMEASIPGRALRADSPTLPANQRNIYDSSQNSSDTKETIKLQISEE